MFSHVRWTGFDLTRATFFELYPGTAWMTAHFLQCGASLPLSLFLAAAPEPRNRPNTSAVCSQARAACEETWAGCAIQSPGRRGAGRWIKRRRRRLSVRFEFRISGGEHVSGEWATGNRIIVVHSRETQEGPGTGNWPRHTHTHYLFLFVLFFRWVHL